MKVEPITLILNVSNIAESFAWFEKLGWKKKWDWGDPPTFGAVGCDKCEIFLCQGAQGAGAGRSRGPDCPVGTPDGRTAHVVSPQHGQTSWCRWYSTTCGLISGSSHT
jgi:hypothetical protein